jgi:hypothetical protein
MQEWRIGKCSETAIYPSSRVKVSLAGEIGIPIANLPELQISSELYNF